MKLVTSKKLFFISIFIISLMCCIYPFYFYKRNLLMERAKQSLNNIADDRLAKLSTYFRKIHKNLDIIAANSYTIQNFNQFHENFKDKNIKSEQYKKNENDYKKYLNLNLPNEEEYINLFLISTGGDVIFSRSNRVELGTNLLTGPYSDTSFNTSLKRVLMTLTYDIEETSFYPITKGNAIFVLVPIVHDYKIIGVIAVEFGFGNLFSLVTNYNNLGRTGEVIIAQWEGFILKYVSNVRHSLYTLSWNLESALKKNAISSFQQYAQGQEVEFVGDQSKILYDASLGNITQGKGLDYRDTEVYSTGRYYVDADWGLIVKMDIDEILEPLKFIDFLAQLISYAALTLLIIFLSQFIITFFGIKNIISFTLLTLGIILLIAGFYFIYRSKAILSSVVDSHIAQDKKDLLPAQKQIVAKLDDIKYIADNLAYNIKHDLITPSDYEIYIKRVLGAQQNVLAFAVAFKPYEYQGKPQYTTYGVKENNKVKCCQLEKIKQIAQPQEDYKAIWFHETLSNPKPQWFNNYIEPITGKKVIAYAVPFNLPNAKGNSGVVVIMYSFEDIENIVNGVYASLISQTGHFMVDYTHKYIHTLKNVNELATSINESKINNIAKIFNNENSQSSYFNDQTNRKEWLFSLRVPGVNWMLMIEDSTEDMLFPYKELQENQFLIIVCMILAAVLLLASLFAYINFVPFLFSLLLTFIQAIGLIALYITIHKYVMVLNNPSAPMEYEVYITNFIKELNEDAFLKFKKPLMSVKTGIELTNLDLKHNNVSLTSFIWQKLPIKVNFTPEILFPQAAKSTLTLTQQYEAEGSKIFNWSAYNEIFQSDSAEHYPFDVKKIEISLQYPKTNSNIIFVPDLAAYSNTGISLIGMGNISTINEFNVKKSFFEYKIPTVTNTVQQLKPMLTFSIMLQRSLLTPFLVYIMPLLLILIALFTVIFAFERAVTSAVGLTWKSRFLAVVTAILLSLVMLHRNLRSDLQSEGIVYIEYLFFSIYLTMSILALYIVFVEESIKIKINGRSIPIVTFLYWPLEVFTWLIATIVVFY